ncbi:hypothetical protein PCCS19_01040 [Paenibacillus sp. CCS19]|uniref:hypothetical protein n=1 Tax=Paenibacillus sp. CCS19 TaxID=3158387 RepID=UPI00256E61FB|nr:hypothetical protein [Paenibacillus cellulosilyticus]GMK37051.1 hypothetical protein PCCS19_01040 [Paenibacillus cellulosilyticus]
MTQNGISVAIIRGEKVLMVKENKASIKNKWNFPSNPISEKELHKRIVNMFNVTLEINQERKNQLLEWITSHENATGEYDKGVLVGLRWMIDKFGVNDFLYTKVSETSLIIINQDCFNECTEKFEENWTDDVWNSGFALAIIEVLDLCNIQVVEFPTPKRTNNTLC